MATVAKTTGGRILTTLQDEFCECPICTEEYDECRRVPRLLPCQHSFCTECLTKNARGNKLICSLCKKSYNLKEKGIEIFPKDLTRRNLKDMIGRLVLRSCSICNRMESVRYLCRVCNINLCKTCCNLRKSSECKAHSLSKVKYDDNESPDTSLDSLEANVNDVCTLEGHEHNKLKFYCQNKQCRKSICSNCAIREHKKHEWEELDVVYHRRKNLLLDRLSTAKKKIELAKKVKSLYNNDSDKVLQNLSLMKMKVNREKQEGINYLNEESDRICEFYKKIAGKLTQNFETNLFLITYIENADECCSISEQLLKENKQSFLSVENAILDKLEIFGSESFEYRKSNLDLEQLFREEEYESFKQKVTALKNNPPSCNDIMELSVIGVDEKGKPLVRMTKKKSIFKEGISMCAILLKIITLLAALFFVWRECQTWMNLPYCEMDICDETSLTFTNSTSLSAFCRSDDETLAASHLEVINGNGRCENKDNIVLFQGVFLNTTLRLYEGYKIFKFRILLSDFSKLSIGRIVFKVGFYQGPVHDGTNNDGLEWRLVRSQNGELMELLNAKNHVVERIRVTSNERLLLIYEMHFDNASKSIKIVNMQTKGVLDTFDITKTYFRLTKTFFQLYENSIAKASLTSLSKKVGFTPAHRESSVYILKDNKTVRNYRSLVERDIKTPLIQDIEINNCTRLCVIPLKILFPSFVADVSDSFELHLASSVDTDESLLLSTAVCNSYFSHAIEYVFNVHAQCLVLNMGIYENNTIIPGDSSSKAVLLINKEKSQTTLYINYNGYTFPTPRAVSQKRFILRFKVYNAMQFAIRLDNYKLFSYMYYMFNMVSFFVYIENTLILVSVLFAIYVFITFCKKRMTEK